MLLRLERFVATEQFCQQLFYRNVSHKCSFRKIIDNLVGSPVRGGGAVQDAMGRWGHGRYHGTPVKGSRAVKDTMGLLSRVGGP